MTQIKKNIFKFLEMKKKNIPTAWITAYDYPFAIAAENSEVDMILVGDSGGMVQLGYKTTNPVTMDEMIHMAKAARKGAPNTFLIGDMPQGSYEVSEKEAVKNALRFIKEAGCDAIKCEGGTRIFSKVKAITDAGILVMGHLGLTPQSTQSFGGYRVQGKSIENFEKTVEEAFLLEQAGVFSILLEAMPQEPAGKITQNLNIPIYGIGAGNLVDGQLLIMHDLLGFYQNFRPTFAKCYIPEVLEDFALTLSKITDLKEYGRKLKKDGFLLLAELAIKKYVKEVKTKKFPTTNYSYPIDDQKLEELKKSKYWKKTVNKNSLQPANI